MLFCFGVWLSLVEHLVRDEGCWTSGGRPFSNDRSGAEIAGSNPVSLQIKVNIGVWLSLVEHLVRDEGAAGSNPVTPML